VRRTELLVVRIFSLCCARHTGSLPLRSYSPFDVRTHPHQIIFFSQAHKLRVYLHAPDLNPLNGFTKKKKKSSPNRPLHACHTPCQDWCSNSITAQLGLFCFLLLGPQSAPNQFLAHNAYRQLPNWAHLFFLFLFSFLAYSQLLVGYWPTIHTNNSPIGLIKFHFIFVHGLQSAPFQFLARCQAQKKKKK
jgi:hypothetical protein